MQKKDDRWDAVPVFPPPQRLGSAGFTPGRPVIHPALSPRRRWIGTIGRVNRGVVSLRGHMWPLLSARKSCLSPAMGNGDLFFTAM